MKKRFSPALIGSFVVSGIVLVVAAVILVGSGRFFDQTRTYVSFFPGSVNGLTVGSNVSFRGVPIGKVTSVLLSLSFDVDNMGQDMRIPVIYEIDLGVMDERGVTDAGINDLQVLLDRGISARLDTESFVTGRLYVSLDFRPDTERFTQGRETPYPEIPTVRSPIAEVGNSLQQLADRFVAMDVGLVVDEFRETLAGMNTLLTSNEIQTLPGEMSAMLARTEETLTALQDLAVSVEGSIAPIEAQIERIAQGAERQMADVQRALASVEGSMDPRAPGMVGLVSALNELQLAAESLRRTADLIERRPDLLLRGRGPGGN